MIVLSIYECKNKRKEKAPGRWPVTVETRVERDQSKMTRVKGKIVEVQSQGQGKQSHVGMHSGRNNSYQGKG